MNDADTITVALRPEEARALEILSLVGLRLTARLERRGECLVWTGARSDNYGQISVGAGASRRRAYVHRLVYELTRGPLVAGLLVCHHCDNPPCSDPAHLFAGTVADNNRDMTRKGHNAAMKLTPEQVREIRRRYLAGDVSQYALAREFSVSQTSINHL